MTLAPCQTTVISNKVHADVEYRNAGKSSWKFLTLDQRQQLQVNAFGEYHWPDHWEDSPEIW